MAKVDLTLLKKLVVEMEAQLAHAESRKVEGVDPLTYVVELSKCAGLAMAVSSESTALVSDMIRLAQSAQSPKEDALAKLLGALGGGGLPGSN